MSETISAAQPQAEAVRGEGSDVALAKVLQEQEQAWLHLLQSQSPNIATSSLGDESLGARETASSVPSQPCVSSSLNVAMLPVEAHCNGLFVHRTCECNVDVVDWECYPNHTTIQMIFHTVWPCICHLLRLIPTIQCTEGSEHCHPCAYFCDDSEQIVSVCCRPTMPETDDWAFALEMQQQEYRQHAIRLAALQQQEHGNMDVDSMSYESLSMLGDTVGTVKVLSVSILVCRVQILL